MVRYFHKPRDTIPNKYPSNTPIIKVVENEGEICMQKSANIFEYLWSNQSSPTFIVVKDLLPYCI